MPFNLTIKGKLTLLAAAAALTMLAMAGLLHYTATTITTLQDARVLTARVEVGMLTLRRHEKDFLARRDLKYRDKFQQDFEALRATLGRLGETLVAGGQDGAVTTALGAVLEDYATKFAALVSIQEEIGLDEKDGLHGSLRNAVHEAEEVLKGVESDRLLKDMLMLRRNEKDFMQRLDDKYLGKFEKNHAILMADLDAGGLPGDLREVVADRMARYRQDFQSLVEGYRRKGLTPKEGVLGEMRTSVHRTETTLEELSGSLEEVLGRETTHLQRLVMLLALIFGAALAVAIILMARSVVRSIQVAVARMSDIAEGEGDLTATLDEGSGDEMAALARAFNLFVGKIRGVVRQLGDASDQLASAAEQSSRISEESSEALGRQRDETDQVATAIHEMSQTVQSVAANASEAAQAAARAADEAANGQRVVGDAIHSIQHLADGTHQAAQVIQRLAQNSNDIGTVLDVIRGIAEQTNLLALNAAIEAARAGETGRGFAVVADEVRTLASRTQESTREIQTMIERLQAGVEEAVEVMEGSSRDTEDGVSKIGSAGSSLEAITSAVRHIADMNTQIASAAEQQGSVAEEINRNVVNITEVMRQTAQGSEQTAQAGEDLSRLAVEMNRMVAQFRV